MKSFIKKDLLSFEAKELYEEIAAPDLRLSHISSRIDALEWKRSEIVNKINRVLKEIAAHPSGERREQFKLQRERVEKSLANWDRDKGRLLEELRNKFSDLRTEKQEFGKKN